MNIQLDGPALSGFRSEVHNPKTVCSYGELETEARTSVRRCGSNTGKGLSRKESDSK